MSRVNGTPPAEQAAPRDLVELVKDRARWDMAQAVWIVADNRGQVYPDTIARSAPECDAAFRAFQLSKPQVDPRVQHQIVPCLLVASRDTMDLPPDAKAATRDAMEFCIRELEHLVSNLRGAQRMVAGPEEAPPEGAAAS